MPFDAAALAANLNAWFIRNVWTKSTLIELILILACFVFGRFLGKILYRRATAAIDASRFSVATRRMARSARRILPPLTILALLFIVTQMGKLPLFALDVSLNEAVMKALLAWITIRLAFQFIGNGVVRSVATWTIWAVAALSIFGILDQTRAFMDKMAIEFGSFRISVLNVFNTALLLFILIYLALAAAQFFERKLVQSKKLSRSSQALLTKTIRLGLVATAFIIGVTSSGIDLSIFTVFSGAIGLGVGFGLQRSVSNLFSGMLLLMDQSIKPGDIVELEKDGTFGWVNQMAARYTEIVTRDNKSYLIPNEDFITQRVVNWSHGDSLVRLEVGFGAHYDSNPHDVIRIALEAVKKIDHRIARNPEPQCHLKEFGDSSINFIMRFWITDAEHGVSNIKSDVLLAVWDAFKAHGVQIPYPHREVYLHGKV